MRSLPAGSDCQSPCGEQQKLPRLHQGTRPASFRRCVREHLAKRSVSYLHDRAANSLCFLPIRWPEKDLSTQVTDLGILPSRPGKAACQSLHRLLRSVCRFPTSVLEDAGDSWELGLWLNGFHWQCGQPDLFFKVLISHLHAVPDDPGQVKNPLQRPHTVVYHCYDKLP